MSAQAECSPECYLQSKTKIEPDLRLGNGLIGLSPTTEGDAAVGLYICKWVKCRFSWKKKKRLGYCWIIRLTWIRPSSKLKKAIQAFGCMSCRILRKILTSSYIGKCDILHRLRCRGKTPGIFIWAGEMVIWYLCVDALFWQFSIHLYGWRILYKPWWRPGISLERYNKLQLVRYSNRGGCKGVREGKWEIWKVTRSWERSWKNVGCKDKGDSGSIGGIRIITYDNIFVGQTHLGNYWISNNGGSSIVKVAEHSFCSLWIYVICQIMVRERLQITSWNLASEKYTDKRFWLTVKMWRFRSFHGNMNDWIFQRCCLSLLKTSSDNFQYGQFCSLHRVCNQSINLYIQVSSLSLSCCSIHRSSAVEGHSVF